MCAAGHMTQHMRKKDDDETKGDSTFPYVKGVHYTIYIIEIIDHPVKFLFEGSWRENVFLTYHLYTLAFANYY